MFAYKMLQLDYVDYAMLRQSVGWTNFSQIQEERALARSLCMIVALDEGNKIGMARLTGDEMYMLLADVVVRPEYQGSGIGKEMVRQLLNWVQRQIPPGGKCSVQLTSEPGKELFYEKLGFCRLPAGTCGAGMWQIFRG